MVRGGRDVRAWIAFAFGLIHGFGFANVLREMDLPARALGWSLFSFNLGVEIGQLVVVVVVASVLAAVRARGARSRPAAGGRRLGRRHRRRRVLVHPAGVLWGLDARVQVPRCSRQLGAFSGEWVIRGPVSF